MLPSIINVATDNNLEFDSKSLNKKEVRCKCPFCRADAHKPKKYYLSLNPRDNVFRCWYCGEKGGVLQFEVKLTGEPYEKVKQKYFGSKKHYHPAELLSPRQLEKIDLLELKKDWKQFKRSLKQVHAKWQKFVDQERSKAFAKLLVGLEINKYQLAIELIKKQAEKSEIPSLLDDVLKMYSSSTWEKWAVAGREKALIAYKSAEQAGDKRKALMYLAFCFYQPVSDLENRKQA